MQEYKLNVSRQEAGMRLDLFLMRFSRSKKLGLSRNSIQKLISEKRASSGCLSSLKPNYRVKAGEEIRIKIEEKKRQGLTAENIPLDIVYEDDDLAVINKPSGLVVHPAPGNYEHTLVNAILHRFKKLSDINPQRPGIVHRLDKETSGLIVIAKNNFVHLALARQFSRHSIKRKYLALVKGKVEFQEHVIEMPIGRHPYKRKNMSVGFGKNSKYAKTYYRTIKRKENFSFLELKPYTGRTHQLRVHLNFIGHPILGDTKYGRDKEFKRLALHAESIGFIHPRSNQYLEFSCELPREFKEFIGRNK